MKTFGMKPGLISLVIILCSFSYLTFTQTAGTEVETLRNMESDENFKQQRLQWIEQMHRTEPNVNWRIIDNATRLSRRDLRQKEIEKTLRSGNNTLQSDEDVAGGYLTGSWIEKGSNNLAGRIHTADMDAVNGVIYAASSGGNIWECMWDGSNWKCLNNGFQFNNIRKVKFLPFNNTNRIFVLENTKAYYTDNEGLLWQTAKGTTEVSNTGSFQEAVIAKGDTLGIFIKGGVWNYNESRYNTQIYLSKDYGANFQKVFLSDLKPELCDIWSPQNHSNLIYILNKDTLMSIDISGKTANVGLLKAQQPIGSYDRLYLRGSFTSSASKFYCFLHNSSSGIYEIYSSTDMGNTWFFTGSQTFGPFEQNSMSVSADNENLLFYGGMEAYKSLDGGTTWNKINDWGAYYGNIKTLLHADIPGIVPIPNPFGDEIILIGTDGGLYISWDHMQTVENLSLSGLNVSQYYSVYTNRTNYNKIYAGSQDQGLQRCLLDSEGKAVSFEQVISGDYGHLASSDGGKSVWSVYPGFAQLYKNFDTKNTTRIAWDFKGTGGLWMPPLIEDPANPLKAYLACGGVNGTQNIWHLDATLGSINPTMMPFNFNNASGWDLVSAMRFSPLDNNIFYTLTSQGHFFSSTNAGTDWTANTTFQGPAGHYFYGSSIEASHITQGKLYIAGSGYSNPGVYMSTDNGVNFTPLDSGLPKTMIYKIAISHDDKYIFAATEVGPYVYVAAQNRWFDLASSNTPDQTYWSVEYLDEIKTARFVTYGRGIWDFKISSFNEKPAGVNELANKITPVIKLSAYPNPVSTHTTINVEMSQSASGTLRIYDLSGKVVAELFNGKFVSGTNSFIWDGLTENGENLPSGYYMCVVSSMGISNYMKLEK